MLLWPAALSHRLQDVAGGGQADLRVDGQGRLPVPRRSMENEAAIHLDRAAEVDRQPAAGVVAQRDVDLLEQSS